MGPTNVVAMQDTRACWQQWVGRVRTTTIKFKGLPLYTRELKMTSAQGEATIKL